MKRILAAALSLPFAGLLAWIGFGAYLQAGAPRVTIERVANEPVSGEKTLPFFELMSPVPVVAGAQLLPKLEYKKGPPARFLERITLLVRGSASRERIVYHGRRSRNDLPGLALLGPSLSAEARYMETALLLSQGQPTALPAWKEALLRPLLLREISPYLQHVDHVEIMEQAGEPAFFFNGTPGEGGRRRSTALFVRHLSFYRVDYVAEGPFLALDPVRHFRRSFLVDKRSDATDFVARNLSAVRLEQKEVTAVENIAWPILLLAANVSVEPSSLDAYFHFAGISALLYRSLGLNAKAEDGETLDVLRNNVLAAAFYARDVSPRAPRTAEIGRLARLLTQNFE